MQQAQSMLGENDAALFGWPYPSFRSFPPPIKLVSEICLAIDKLPMARRIALVILALSLCFRGLHTLPLIDFVGSRMH